MVEETQTDCIADADNPNPVALSVAGGATGTIAGLKRGGLPGAVIGGLVGGTIGYLSGASCASMGDSDRSASDSEPIRIDTTEADEDDAADNDAEETDAADDVDDESP